jgi:hypothetical protein
MDESLAKITSTRWQIKCNIRYIPWQIDFSGGGGGNRPGGGGGDVLLQTIVMRSVSLYITIVHSTCLLYY